MCTLSILNKCRNLSRNFLLKLIFVFLKFSRERRMMQLLSIRETAYTYNIAFCAHTNTCVSKLPILVSSCADSIRHGRTKQPETSTSGRQTVYLIFDDISPVLTLNSSEQYRHWTFLASIHVNLSHANQSFFRGVLLLLHRPNFFLMETCIRGVRTCQ